jgi:hypothetical protein
MDPKADLREFLASRRARITPELAGLPKYGTNRRVKGLRREEVDDVKLHRTGAKQFRHPTVGDLTLDFESIDLPADAGQRLLVYTAEPGSPSQQALDLLASWTAPDGLLRDEHDVEPR